MATTSNLASQLEAELICAVCQERFTVPRVLPCQHSFCESCLSMAHLAREHRGRLLPCPTCRAVSVIPDNGVPGFPINFALNNLVQILVATETEVRRTPQEYCSLHENKRITMYCCECRVTICSSCATSAHKPHRTEIIADVIDSERSALEATRSDAGTAVEGADVQINDANLALEKLTKQAEAAVIRINKQVDDAIGLLNKRKMSLVSQVNALKAGQTERITSLKEDLKRRSKNMKGRRTAIDSLLQTMDDTAFLQGLSEFQTDMAECSGAQGNLEPVLSWIDFTPVQDTLATQIECLELGEVKLTKEEPRDTDSILNSRVNTARVSARRHRTRNNGDENNSDVHINLERVPRDVTIRYPTQQQEQPPPRTLPRPMASPGRIRAVHQIGSCGTSLGDFFHPCGMGQLANGHIVVADQRNNRVQILEENGNFVQIFGNEGNGVREFRAPGDIAVDGQDNIFVLDTRNDRIQVFTSEGRFKRIIGCSGTGQGQFIKPQAITIAGECVVVADSGNNRVQVLSLDGRFSHTFGREGTGEGEFMEPCGVAVSPTGDLFVCDHHNHRVQIFRLSNGNFVSTFGSFGSDAGQMSYPSSIAVDLAGTVLVTEYGNDRLSVFDSFGRFKMCFGEEGNDLGQFLSPNGVSVCSQDSNNARNRNVKFYVCDAWNHRLQMLEMIV